MSEQISKELLKIMNEITENDSTIAKIEASIFIRNSKKIIDEKVAYLYNMIKIEAKNCHQRQDVFFEESKLIISHYKQKLNMVYDEFYCKYVNIQNELQESRINKLISMINYQKIVNDQENGHNSNNEEKLKEEIKEKSNVYKEIINMCNIKSDEAKEQFEKMINESFSISSKTLQITAEQSPIKRIINWFSNIFNGEQKYKEILDDYNKSINKIDSYEIVKQMRNDTVEFVAKIIEKRGIDKAEIENMLGEEV